MVCIGLFGLYLLFCVSWKLVLGLFLWKWADNYFRGKRV